MSVTACPIRPVQPRRMALAIAVCCTTLALAAAALHSSSVPTPTAQPRGVEAHRTAVTAPLDDAGYLRFADHVERLLDGRWSERHGRYRPGRDLTETMVNGNLLLVHAVAAQRGHTGPARNDRRARSIVRWLVDSPIWTERVRKANKQAHVPGWVAETGGWQQHLVIDAEVVDGLTHAFRARRALTLPERSVRLLRDRIGRLAASRYWRWPTIRLNQFNWHLLVFAGDATVNGRRATLARGAAAHLERFTRGVGPKGHAAGNLGPGLRFHYLPHERAGHPMNVDSAEYANIVLGFSRFYEQARSAGMPRPRRLRLLREWVRRAVAGYWTHGGYANWDTGHGFERLHQMKKLGLMQQALIGIAATEELQPSRAWGAWTKWLLDRSLAWYDAEAAAAGRLPDPIAFGVNAVPLTDADAALAATRIAANAARAVAAGLGRARAVRPPALYAYDPDTGRLAVTTPAYSTAIVAVNQGAFPYGGIDLARLLDGRGRVAATIGGQAPVAFGVAVRDAGDRIVLASQRGRAHPGRAVSPLRLTRAPEGVGAHPQAAPVRAYAGPFTDLVATGSTGAAGMTATSRYRFTPRAIEGRWSLVGTPPAGARVDVLFPSTGAGASVVAQLRDGETVRLGSEAIALSRIDHVDVRSARGGYRVTPLERPAGSAVRLEPTRPQPSAPTPGPTTAVALPYDGGATFAARITPFPAGA
jgi:hypothetical protein